MTELDAKRPRLLHGEEGAIMVIGVFMAILLVGVLYYIAGIGQAVFQRERMQDAADAVALGTAIGHARGMNLIVFINLVMAGLVAILLALKVIELLLTGLALLLTAISWFLPPAAAAIPIVLDARTVVADVHDAAKEIVDTILIGLNLAERAIAVITPTESIVTATLKVQDKYGDMIDVAVGVPPRLTLPVENDKYDVLCDEGGKILGKLIKKATEHIPLIGKVLDLLTDGLIYGVKRAFCYEDGTAPPSAPIKITRNLGIEQHPGLDCEDDKANMRTQSSNCDEWEQELRDRHPESDGNCPTSGDRQAVCDKGLLLSRQQCNIYTQTNAQGYSWATQDVKEVVVFDTTSWTWVTDSYAYVGSPVLKNTSTHDTVQSEYDQAKAAADNGDRSVIEQADVNAPPQDKSKPCDNGNLVFDRYDQPEQLWSDWNQQVYFDTKPGRRDQGSGPVVMPVCSKRLQAVKSKLPDGGVIPPGQPGDPLPAGYGGSYILQYPTVKQVYGCTQDVSLDLKFPAEWSDDEGGQSNGEDKAPQKMEDGEKLGGSDFQIRGFAMDMDGSHRSGKISQALRRSAFGRPVEDEGWVGVARATGNVAIAQAEYYFNTNGVDNAQPYDWMWHMEWKARLVHFRMSSGDDDSTTDDQSGLSISSLTGSDDSPGLASDLLDVKLPGGAPSLDTLDKLIVH
jgi:hypothetical protein